jgi:hypothetical protein
MEPDRYPRIACAFAPRISRLLFDVYEADRGQDDREIRARTVSGSDVRLWWVADDLRYDKALRRLWAIFLLALFSFSLIGPTVAADSDSNLPACCRRFGKHHCSMSGNPSSGPAARSARCAAFPETMGPGIVFGVFVLGLAASPFVRFIVRPSARNVLQISGLVSLGGPHDMRGPPVSPAFA